MYSVLMPMLNLKKKKTREYIRPPTKKIKNNNIDKVLKENLLLCWFVYVA